MKTHFFPLIPLFLCGCTAQQLKPILDNLSHDCDRHYTFAVGALGTTVTGQIDCKAEGTTTTTTVTTPKVSTP